MGPDHLALDHDTGYCLLRKMGSEDQDIRTGLQSLVQSWRACLNIVAILAVVSLPAVAVAQDAGDIQRLERQLEDLANQVCLRQFLTNLTLNKV